MRRPGPREQVIESSQNALVRHARSLETDRKTRSRGGEYLAWGVPMVWIIDPVNLVAWEFSQNRPLHEVSLDGSLTAPEIARLTTAVPLLCVYGSEESATTGCHAGPNTRVVVIEGGHHLGGDYQRLVTLIEEQLPKQMEQQ